MARARGTATPPRPNTIHMDALFACLPPQLAACAGSNTAKIFMSCDKDGDGKVTKAELAVKIAKDGDLEKLLGEDDITRMGMLTMLRKALEADADGDGALSYTEFQAMVKLSVVRKLFESCDKDSDGKVSKGELAMKIRADSELEDALGVQDIQRMGMLKMLGAAFESDKDGDKTDSNSFSSARRSPNTRETVADTLPVWAGTVAARDWGKAQ